MPTPTQFNKRLVYFIFLSVLVLGVQTIRIQRPFLGHYASYQATVMASISRNMIQENFSDLLLPKTDLIISGKKSLHLNQYPFPSLIAALGVKLFGGTLEFWGRFQSIFFNYLSIILIWFIGRELFNPETGLIAAGVFGLSPYTLIYGQAFMSEALSLFFMLFSFYLAIPKSNKNNSSWGLILSSLCLSIALTGRLHLIVFVPIFFYLYVRNNEGKLFKALIFALISLAMPIAWYLYTYFAAFHFDHVHTNMFLQIGAQNKSTLFTSPNFWRHLFDIFSQTMLTPLLFPFSVLSLLITKKSWSFWLVVASITLGFSVIFLAPEKVMAHDFYLYGLFPFLALLTAVGLEGITRPFSKLKDPAIAAFLMILLLAVSSRYFFHPIYKSESINNLNSFRQAIEKKTNQEDQFIVFGNDPGGIFYYVNRPGYVLQPNRIGQPLQSYLKNSNFKKEGSEDPHELEEAMKDPVTWFEYLKNQGASYFFAVNKKELESLPALFHYLLLKNELISEKMDDFYLFKISGDKT